jgi:hypothetical protein
MVFIFIGMYYSGFSKGATPYWIFLLLLVPSVVLSSFVLFFTPLFLYIENKFNMFLLCFVTFWFFTINHAAMRTAAPAFVYSLSLINVYFGEVPKKRIEAQI